MKNQVGRATVAGRDFRILPRNSSSPPGLESFERRLFCCEARGVMLCGADTAGIAIGALGRGKNTRGKARRTQQHFANAMNFDNVYANGNNHR